jgi:predicted NBD/HSP70 family sugar kinase
MSKELHLGIDMGGTHIKIAIVTSKGLIEEETFIDTDINEKPVKSCKIIISKHTHKLGVIGAAMLYKQ